MVGSSSQFTLFTSDFPATGPPHGFGKHIDQVSAHDFETFEVVRKTNYGSIAILRLQS